MKLRKHASSRNRPHVKIRNLADKDLNAALSNMFKALEENTVVMTEQMGTLSEESETSENEQTVTIELEA